MQRKIKIRKKWDINPVQKPHSTKSGVKGYSRRENKMIEYKINKGEE